MRAEGHMFEVEQMLFSAELMAEVEMVEEGLLN
jgi:hypothetical protein